MLYISIDRYDAGSDMRSAAGLEIKRQIIPWYSAANQLKTPAGENGFADNNETKNPYLVEYGSGLNTLRATWYHQYMIWEKIPKVNTKTIAASRATGCTSAT